MWNFTLKIGLYHSIVTDEKIQNVISADLKPYMNYTVLCFLKHISSVFKRNAKSINAKSIDCNKVNKIEIGQIPGDFRRLASMCRTISCCYSC